MSDAANAQAALEQIARFQLQAATDIRAMVRELRDTTELIRTAASSIYRNKLTFGELPPDDDLHLTYLRMHTTTTPNPALLIAPSTGPSRRLVVLKLWSANDAWVCANIYTSNTSTGTYEAANLFAVVRIKSGSSTTRDFDFLPFGFTTRPGEGVWAANANVSYGELFALYRMI